MPLRWLSPVGQLLSLVGLGILTPLIPPRLIDEAMAVSGRGEQRFRTLPSRFGVYFVLGLCLLRSKSTASVIRAMIPVATLSRLRAVGWALPSTTALSKLKDRIGAVPLQLLFAAMAAQVPTRHRTWSHVFGLRLFAWDGTELALLDTDDNREQFRRHRGKDGPCGAPKARVLALMTCGTRQLTGAVIGALGAGEVTLAALLLPRLRAGMLLLADRNFLGYKLWTAATATGADLLWRATNTLHLPVYEALPDGSYLSKLIDPEDKRRVRHNTNRNRKRGNNPPKPRPLAAVTVRVVEAMITVTVGATTRTERYRLVTTLLDHQHAPAAQIADTYARRWAVETGFKDLKTVLLAGRALRGKTPVRVHQEIWAALIVYQTLKLVTVAAALTQDLDPARISFTAVRDAAQNAITTTHRQATRHAETLYSDLCHQLIIKHTTCRVYPRAVKQTPTRYPYKTKTWQLTSNNASYQVQITATPTSPPQPATSATPAQPRAA
jgi:hypothetical protein